MRGKKGLTGGKGSGKNMFPAVTRKDTTLVKLSVFTKTPLFQIWRCLAENAVFIHDREACFKWFSKLMGEEPDLDPEINKDFFENNILQLDPCLMTESGIKCFDRFFKAVNCKENKLIAKRRAYLMDDMELIGMVRILPSRIAIWLSAIVNALNCIYLNLFK